MADKSRRFTTYHVEKDSKSKSKKRNRDTKDCSNESKTPPLPAKRNCSMEELMKERESIKEELEKIEKFKSETNLKISMKHNNTEQNSKYTKCKIDLDKIKKANSFCNKKKLNETSPDYTQESTQLDSEDEEYIIEQRRKQRREFLQQFNNENMIKEELYDQNSTYLRNDEKQSEIDQNTPVSIQTKSSKIITDMFSEEDFVPKNSLDNVTEDTSKENIQLKDNWDDPEGYYKITVGDVINKERYTIKSQLGQGVFANVVKAVDNTINYEVAIKIIRNNDLMYNTGLKEIQILKEVNDSDPEDKYHCVKLQSHFMHKGHLCLVLESLHMDLRSVLKKYGKNHGINMKALMSYSRQLLLALRLLKKIGIVHADIKPDNILVNEKKNILKLCDFGSAAKIIDNEPTPYLVSRFYRAPEIILGIPFKHSVDTWSTACTIYEMATGKILFTGGSNNKMLKCFMDVKGRIPSKIIKKGKFKDQHFNYNNNFLLHKKDEFTGREKVVEICNVTISRDLLKDIKKSYKGATQDEEKKITQLKDLLDKMLILDSNQRPSATDCLKHPFIQEELKKNGDN